MYRPGESGNPNGRVKGIPNKLTKSVKEVFHHAFNEMQNDPEVCLLEWGKKNPGFFYQLASKLIPAEINANLSGTLVGLLAELDAGKRASESAPK